MRNLSPRNSLMKSSSLVLLSSSSRIKWKLKNSFIQLKILIIGSFVVLSHDFARFVCIIRNVLETK